MQIETKKLSFEQIVETTTSTRTSGDEATLKRSDIRDTLPEIPHLIFPDKEVSVHMSLGYVERLFRKLAHEFPQATLSAVRIIDYSEACGLFSGSIEWTEHSGDAEIERNIGFAWQGKGSVETSWDQFIDWEINDEKR
ncbi:MAG: hypothetical protein ABUK01_12645 [Leptospirales bacterium]